MKDDPPIHEPPTNRVIVLKNCICVYCGIPLGTIKSNKEHVIGKNFVPRGTLDGNWNLIVRACESCNSEKGKLENDISAITMQPDARGNYATDDPYLKAEAIRKGYGSKSYKTGKRVNDSVEKLRIELPVGDVKMGLGFTGPPQLDDSRAFRLAFLHSRGFFYWITYKAGTENGGFWPGGFFPLQCAPTSDWGNPLQRSFMHAVADWRIRILGVSANGFFKVAMRRDSATALWSWAFEWNQRFRVIGFFGNEAPARIILKKLSPAPTTFLRQNGNEVTRYRTEIPISPEDDRLFSR